MSFMGNWFRTNPDKAKSSTETETPCEVATDENETPFVDVDDWIKKVRAKLDKSQAE